MARRQQILIRLSCTQHESWTVSLFLVVEKINSKIRFLSMHTISHNSKTLNRRQDSDCSCKTAKHMTLTLESFNLFLLFTSSYFIFTHVHPCRIVRLVNDENHIKIERWGNVEEYKNIFFRFGKYVVSYEVILSCVVSSCGKPSSVWKWMNLILIWFLVRWEMCSGGRTTSQTLTLDNSKLNTFHRSREAMKCTITKVFFILSHFPYSKFVK